MKIGCRRTPHFHCVCFREARQLVFCWLTHRMYGEKNIVDTCSHAHVLINIFFFICFPFLIAPFPSLLFSSESGSKGVTRAPPVEGWLDQKTKTPILAKVGWAKVGHPKFGQSRSIEGWPKWVQFFWPKSVWPESVTAASPEQILTVVESPI